MRNYLIVTILCLSAASSAQAEKQLLRWKLKEGEVYSLKMSIKSHEDYIENEKTDDALTFKRRQTIDVEADVTWTVTDVSSDIIGIDMTLDRIRFKQKDGSGAEWDWDSATDVETEENRTIAMWMREGLGKVAHAEMTNRGEILSIEPTWKDYQHTFGKIIMYGAGNKPESTLEVLKLLLITLPEEAVDEKETWIYRQVDYWDGGRTTSRADVEIVPGTEATPEGAIRLSAKHVLAISSDRGKPTYKVVSYTGTATADFDSSAGRILKAERNWDLTMKVTMGRWVLGNPVLSARSTLEIKPVTQD